MMKVMIPAIVAMLPGLASAADFDFPILPSSYRPGQLVEVSAVFHKPVGTTEKRVVFLLELRRAADDSLVVQSVFDNSGAGYKDIDYGVGGLLRVPAGTTGPIYVQAVATPWSMNRALVEQLRTYPTDGTFTYLWSGGGYGVTQNIYYLGTLIAPKPTGNTTYCSGLAFDQFVTAYNNYNTAWGHSKIGTMTVTDMRNFRVIWYGAGTTDTERLSTLAVPQYNLGVQITDWEEAQEGDACQLWRWSTSGHNPVFIAWVRDNTGKITGVRYWGSQGSTNGIGYREESFGATSADGGINPARFYLARARKPRDGADYTWAIATVTTKATPILPAVEANGDNWAVY